MGTSTRERLLPPFLIFAGVVSLSAYPLIHFWPSGWDWGHEGSHYLHMILVVYAVLGIFLILAARNPVANRSLLLFTAWSSAAHGGLMAIQASTLPDQSAHLFGDVAAMWVLAIGLAVLMPKRVKESQ